MNSKTRTTRRTKDFSIRIITSDSGTGYMLFQKDKMVRVRNWTDRDAATLYQTFFVHSLPWSVVRRVLRKDGTGEIRDGWRYSVTPTYVRFGCTTFSGPNLTSLREWASGL